MYFGEFGVGFIELYDIVVGVEFVEFFSILEGEVDSVFDVEFG